MLRSFFIIFIVPICIFSFFSNAMHSVKIRNTRDIVVLGENILGTASDSGCHLVFNFQSNEPTTYLLYDQPTYTLRTNHDKQKIALYSKNCFLVYDLPTKQKIWSHDISIRKNYSAVFNSVDDTIFLYDNGELISNKYNPISLPNVKPNTLFKIFSHPHKEKITYKTMNQTLSTLSLSDGIITQKSALINGHSIVGMLHNPYKKNTIVKTTQKKIFIYNRTYEDNHEVKLDNCIGKFSTITFLPYSSLVAIPCNHKAIHFWDYATQKIVSIIEFIRFKTRKKYTSACSFSPHSMQFIVFTKKSCMLYQTPFIIRKILSLNKYCPFHYWVLQQYSESNNNLFSKDIFGLFAQILDTIYTPEETTFPK